MLVPRLVGYVLVVSKTLACCEINEPTLEAFSPNATDLLNAYFTAFDDIKVLIEFELAVDIVAALELKFLEMMKNERESELGPVVKQRSWFQNTIFVMHEVVDELMQVPVIGFVVENG